MMRYAVMFALGSLVPAAVNAAVPLTGGRLEIALCTGSGAARTISIPLTPGGAPGPGETPCCAKGCHTNSSRKRACH